MTGKGSLTTNPNRRLRWMLAAHVFWLLLVCTLGGWWAHLVLKQAARIAELEGLAGVAAAQASWHRTQRMLYWESGSFFAMLVVITILIFWMYWRDIRRARGLQAFFASVTHELRTPLTSIRLQAESIADGLGEAYSERELVARLLEDTQRLESQVERTLELARVEGGGRLYVRPLPLKAWLARLLKEWEGAYRDRARFQVTIDEAMVEADPSAIQVILKNLLENSLRHARRQPVTIDLSTRMQDGKFVFCFRDDGQGFAGDSSELGAIFSKGPESQGAGVGLYLARMLMERMGGTLRARNVDSGRGFEVELAFAVSLEGRVHE